MTEAASTYNNLQSFSHVLQIQRHSLSVRETDLYQRQEVISSQGGS